MAPSTTADRILELLGSEGVHTAFGLPGVHNLAFWRAAPGGGRPRILSVRHEQTAGYAADGLARATGGLGVALTTTGPGAANAVAAFGEASAAQSAVLVVSSEAPLGLRRPGVGHGALHEMRDQSSLFAPLAKATFSASSAEEALAMTADAVVAATTAPRGAVYLGVPADVLTQPASEAPPLRAFPLTPPDLRDVERAAAVLGGAQRVVVWAGGGCVSAGAERAVTDLAWRLGAPVVTTYAARGLLGVEHPLLVDAPPHEPEVAELIAGADVLLVVGSQLDGMATRNWTMPRPPLLVRIDIDERTVHEGWPPDAAVVGDAALVCEALATRIAPREPWADEVFRLRARLLARLSADPRTSDAAAFLHALDTGWPSAGDIVCDMAVAGYWAGGYAAMPRSRRLQYPVGWGTLGYALPASIGAAAGTRRPVLAVAGDGGVPFAVGELATLVQEGLPVTLLVVDDGGYGMLRYDQLAAGQPQHGVDLHGPDWVALSEAYDLPARTVPSLGGPLRDALAECAESGGPHLLHLVATLHPPRTTSPRWAES